MGKHGKGQTRCETERQREGLAANSDEVSYQSILFGHMSTSLATFWYDLVPWLTCHRF